MRPPEFTGGNPRPCKDGTGPVRGASMRPPEFTGGNMEKVMEMHFYGNVVLQ